MIDCTSLVKFGNMTSGSGLAQIFDNDISDTGYATATQGWAGVSLSSSKIISKVEVTAASNGFDASGLTTSITIDVYAKQGAVPTSATGGTKIGSTGSFTDINSQITKVVNSNSSIAYDHVWVVINTGVWAVASIVNIFEGEILGAPVVVASDRYSLQKSLNTTTPLNWATTEVPGFRIATISDSNAIATCMLRMDIIHNNVFSGAVGIAGRILVRMGNTWAECQSANFTYIPNAVSGKNITDVTDHYGNINIFIKYPLLANKYYEFSVASTAHSTGSSSNGLCSILAEYGQGLNSFIISVDKNEVLV
jgi:hypothetical protein